MVEDDSDQQWVVINWDDGKILCTCLKVGSVLGKLEIFHFPPDI